MSHQPVVLANGSSIPLSSIPVREFMDLRSMILERVAGGSHLASFFAFPCGDEMRLAAVLTAPEEGGLAVGVAKVGDAFPSITPECREAHMFEREMAEQWNIVPRGHPWLKPVRFHAPYAGKRDERLSEWFGGGKGPAVMDFFQVEGEEVHEVAVGPVHAGVIEPGHFRFQCHGEEVMHLEISLGFQHRGVEKSLWGGPTPRTRHLMETLAGDTTCGHAMAYAMNVEALAGLEVMPAAHRARAIALELERIANHVGDLGALAGDVGFLPTASYCGRLRGDILNLTAALCGNRFGRGMIVPGGVGHAINGALAGNVREKLSVAIRDIRGAVKLIFEAPSVMTRFEGTGAVGRHVADYLGMVGPAARAGGLETDVRLDLPHGMYREDLFPLELGTNGDVMDRALQRRKEIDTSARLIDGWLVEDCAAETADPYAIHKLAADSFSVSLSEGWRGQICHVALTGPDGRFIAYKIADPSFHNWTGLAMALRGQQISDFPLCNKSFNLSYCGHDL